MRAWVLIAVAAIGAGLAAAHQPEPDAGGQPGATALPEGIVARLAALDPARPAEYFLLGEDVADLYRTPAERELAQRLFVLAFELDRRQAGASRLAGSACLALADLAALERDRQWLIALARAVDPRFQRTGPGQEEMGFSRVDAYRAATAIGLVRSGDGVAAQQLLKEPGVRQTIQRYERLLSDTGQTGGLRALTAEAERWPCAECANARIVRKFGSNPPEHRLCTNCGGHPGPKLSVSQLVTQLRFESRLLRGIQRSWSAQIAADGGEPIRDPEPSELAAVMGVDPAAVYWRDGRWVSAAEAAGRAGPGTGGVHSAPAPGSGTPPG